MSNGSVQVRLDITAIRDATVCFGAGDQAEYAAALELVGSNHSLAKVDDAKQEELLAAYAQFLNSLTFPFQLVVQVHPVDLGWYVRRVEERSQVLPPELLAVARDHAAYVQGLTRQRTLLERRIYVVVSWSAAAEGVPAARPASFLRMLRAPGVRAASVDDLAFREETIRRQLTDRCDAIARQLSRAGLRATRLDDLGLAQLYHASWAPDVARSQRLRRELADYTALVVGAESRPSRQRSSAAFSASPEQEQRPRRSHE